MNEDFAVFNEVKKVHVGVGDFHLQQLLKFHYTQFQAKCQYWHRRCQEAFTFKK